MHVHMYIYIYIYIYIASQKDHQRALPVTTNLSMVPVGYAWLHISGTNWYHLTQWDLSWVTSTSFIMLLAWFVKQSLVHWYHKCVTIHHVPKCISYHGAIDGLVISRTLSFILYVHEPSAMSLHLFVFYYFTSGYCN